MFYWFRGNIGGIKIENKKIAIGFGTKFYIYNKEDIPFFNDLKITNNKVVFNNKVYDIYKGKNDIAKKRVRFFTKNNNQEYEYADYSLIKYLIEHQQEIGDLETFRIKDPSKIVGHQGLSSIDKYVQKNQDDIDGFDIKI